MRSARSSRSFRPERTQCPHCGRNTRTSSDGVCVECWGRKREGPRLHPASRRERGYFWEELDDLLGGFVAPEYAAWIAGGVLAVCVVAVLLLLT